MTYMERVRQAVAAGDRYIVVEEVTHPSGGGFRRYEGLESERRPETLVPCRGGRLEVEALTLASAEANEHAAAEYYSHPLMHSERT